MTTFQAFIRGFNKPGRNFRTRRLNRSLGRTCGLAVSGCVTVLRRITGLRQARLAVTLSSLVACSRAGSRLILQVVAGADRCLVLFDIMLSKLLPPSGISASVTTVSIYSIVIDRHQTELITGRRKGSTGPTGSVPPTLLEHFRLFFGPAAGLNLSIYTIERIQTNRIKKVIDVGKVIAEISRIQPLLSINACAYRGYK